MIQGRRRILVPTLIAALVIACQTVPPASSTDAGEASERATRRQASEAPSSPDRPIWIGEACGQTWLQDDPPQICGIGWSEIAGRMSIARSRASARARAEISRNLEYAAVPWLERVARERGWPPPDLGSMYSTVMPVPVLPSPIDRVTSLRDSHIEDDQMKLLACVGVDGLRNLPLDEPYRAVIEDDPTSVMREWIAAARARSCDP